MESAPSFAWRPLVLACCLLSGGETPAAIARTPPVGGEFQVNAYTPNGQISASLAVQSDGTFLDVWQSDLQDGSENGIFARRYQAGVAAGAELQVNAFTPGNQLGAAVAVRATGEFVVVWSSNGQDGSSWGVFGRRLDAGGVPQAAEFQVNLYTSGAQSAASVAVAEDGDFVVAWHGADQDGSGYGVFARRWSSTGVAQGGEIQVNTYTTSTQQRPRVAMNADGDFVVAWQNPFQYYHQGIFARRFDASGASVGGEIMVSAQFVLGLVGPPAIAMDDAGAFVITWPSDLDGSAYGVFARRFDAAGAPLDDGFQVNVQTVQSQRDPAVAMKSDGGFVVTWNSYEHQDGSASGIFAREFDGSGAALGSEFQVNSYTPGDQSVAAIGAAGGDFVIAWVSGDQDGSSQGLFAQRFAALAPLDLDGNGEVGALTDGLLLLRFLSGFGGIALTNGAVDLEACTRCAAGSIEPYLTAAAAAPHAVAARGGELPVNVHTTKAQSSPAVGMNESGDFVVAWVSEDQDGAKHGVFARRFDSGGAAQAAELQVNLHTSSYQNHPAVALRDDGAFVVVWQSHLEDGSDYGVFARRFDAAGAGGAEIQINTYTQSLQGFPAVDFDGSGRFVVAWQSSNQDGSFFGVFARRFDANGAALGDELQVNAYTSDFQRAPAVSVRADGSFVVAWHQHPQFGTDYDVFARRFDSSGSALGGDLRVNTYTPDFQGTPRVAAFDGGGFVVSWRSDAQDGSYGGVFAQRFDAAGTALGSELRANSRTIGTQLFPAMAPIAAGGFVVAWESYGQDGGGMDVFAKAFGTGGAPLVPAVDFQVNTYTASQQRYAGIAGGGAGSFVVAWASQGQDGDAYGVLARRLVALTLFDVDGDGSAQPLTDGLLVLRYLFGFRGATLVADAIGPGATRDAAPEIEAYLAGLL